MILQYYRVVAYYILCIVYYYDDDYIVAIIILYYCVSVVSAYDVYIPLYWLQVSITIVNRRRRVAFFFLDH